MAARGEAALGDEAEKEEVDLEKKSKEELITILHGLATDVDKDGLLFLINQSRVLIHNKRVEEINRKILDTKGEVTKKKKHAVKKSPMEVEIVERGDGKHFFIVANNFRIYFTLDEMRKLVKLCHAAENEADAIQRLYRWFSSFRKDFLVDGQIGGSKHPYLADLYKKLISTYRARDDA
jgi:hypothetical protein